MQNICVFQREYGGKRITIVVNLDPDFERSVVFDKSVVKFDKLAQCLSVDCESEATLKDDTLTIPAYSYVVLR